LSLILSENVLFIMFECALFQFPLFFFFSFLNPQMHPLHYSWLFVLETLGLVGRKNGLPLVFGFSTLRLVL